MVSSFLVDVENLSVRWKKILRSLKLGEGSGTLPKLCLEVIRRVRGHINMPINCSFVRSTSKGLPRNHIPPSLPGKSERKPES